MRAILRKWRIEDAESIAELANHPQIAGNLRNAFPHPYTIEDAKAFICSCMEAAEKDALFFAIEVDERAVGSVTAVKQGDVYEKSAELGYWLGKPYWGQGIMTQAIPEICRLAFSQLDIVRIYAEPFAHNIGSCRALEKAGFVLEGRLHKSVYKNGAFYDSCIYALVR